MSEPLRALARTRWRVALTFTGLTVLVYFGFVLLIAFNKPFMSRLIVPGLSVGILAGVLVILASWLLTWGYIRWANQRYDPELDRLRRGARR